MKGWRAAAIWIGMAILLGFCAWLIIILSAPNKWCSVLVGVASVTGQRARIGDCTPILLELIAWLGRALLMFIVGVGLAYLVSVVRELGAHLKFSGPGGFGGEVGQDDHDEPKPVTLTETKPDV